MSNNLLILLDEADLGFHPEWKKKYVNIIQQVIPFIFKNKNIQIIITTHDPLTLSDFPNNNVVYLFKNNKRTEILDYDSKQRPTKTFGANISNLISDSFFINDGLIGDFAKDKIEKVIVELNKLLDLKSNNGYVDISEDKKILIKKTIDIIDESIIKMKLVDMYNTIFEVSIENEINELEERLKYLRNLKSN